MSQQRLNRSTTENRCPVAVVNECVKFIICCEGGKKPIKLSDIEKHLNEVCQIPHDKKAVLEKANEVLKEVYGYKLVQVKGKGIQYIVVLNEPSESLCSTYSTPEHRRLLIAALTHIFMSGGSVKAFDMWNFLSKSKLLNENDHASRKILTTTFTKQLYLEYSKIESSTQQQVEYEFKWGQRADEELSKAYILNKMAEAFQQNPTYWKEQYNIAHENVNNGEVLED